MKKRTRIFGIFLAAIMLTGSVSPVFAGEAGKPEQQKVMAYLKPSVTVKLLDEVLVFKDVNNKVVYPIIYKGTTYLPVRSISVLMQENIEWDGQTKIVFIGRTLTDPAKNTMKTTPRESGYVDADKPADSLITVYLKPDVTVMYDFQTMEFTDDQERRVYPIIYEGSTYLPIRGISNLMGEWIDWDATTQTITIGDTSPAEEEIVYEDSEAARTMKKAYKEGVDLYDQATAKISELQKTVAGEELTLLAVAISEDYHKAQNNTISAKAMKTSDYTKEEMAAYGKLVDFMESAEYYILVMENIAYMAINGTDYSVLAETFFNFAMDSSTKLEAAKKAIYSLEQVPTEEDEAEDQEGEEGELPEENGN